jgi:hypothetical protein
VWGREQALEKERTKPCQKQPTAHTHLPFPLPFSVSNNGIGGDQCSQPSAATVVPAPPSAPTVSSVASTIPGQVDVTFVPSTYLGSPAITNYVVKCVASTVSPQTCAATGAGVVTTTVAGGASPLQASFTGLTPATVYKCFASECVVERRQGG